MKKLLNLMVIAISCSLSFSLIPAQAQKKFPNLEAIEYPDQKVTAIVAREITLEGTLSYSSGYTFPGKTFSRPKFVTFTLYGYFDEPQWKGIKTVTFQFAGKSFTSKPHYQVAGEDRDRSLDAYDTKYFESLLVTIPIDKAREIANNRGVLVTSDPHSFYVSIPASKLDRFKQVVDSIDEFSKPQKTQKSARAQAGPRKKAKVPGIPITEAFNESDGTTTLEADVAYVSNNFGVSALALVAQNGEKLRQPFTALLFTGVGASPIWTDVNSVTLSFGTKKLRLIPNARQSGQTNSGAYISVMTVRVPYKDFLTLSRGKFYVTIGNSNFEVSSWNASGIRELARRISR